MIENAEGNPNISGFQLGFQNWSPWWASPHRISLVNSRFVTFPVSKFGWESVETLCSISWPQADNRFEDTVLFLQRHVWSKNHWRFCNTFFVDLKSMLAQAKKWFLQWPGYLLLVACFSQRRWTLPMLLGKAWMKTWFCTEKSVASLLVKSPNSLWERHFGRSLGQKLRQFSGGRSEMLGWGWVGCVAWRKFATVFPRYHGGKGPTKETPHHCLGWAHELHWYGNLGCFSARLSQIQRWHHRGSEVGSFGLGRNCRIWEDHKQSLGLFIYDSWIVYCIW